MCVYVGKKMENLNWKRIADENRQGYKKVWLLNNGIWEEAKIIIKKWKYLSS